MNDRLSPIMAQLSEDIAKTGRIFNQELLSQFEIDWDWFQDQDLWTQEAVPQERTIFLRSISQTLGWMQPEWGVR